MAAPTGIRALAKRYARGLADAAAKDLGRVAAALDGWGETFRNSEDLSMLLADPRIPKGARTEIAREILTRLDAPEVLLNLVALLIEENRFRYLPVIHSEFMRERDKREGIQTVVVDTAAALSDHVRERIRSRMAEFLRRHIRIQERLQPQILGGVNLRVDNRVWYGGAKQRLEQVFR